MLFFTYYVINKKEQIVENTNLKKQKMKYLGMLIFLIGLYLLYLGFSMDTSVEIDSSGLESFELPKRVHNIGLMAERQNYLIFGGVLCVLGIITFLYYDNNSNEELKKECPRCAEKVQLKAVICRFCNYEFEEDNDSEEYYEPNTEFDEETERIRQNLSKGIFK